MSQVPGKKIIETFVAWWTTRIHRDQSYRSYMLVEACIIGAVSAMAALFFGSGVTALTKVRTALCAMMPAQIALPLYGLFGGIICGCFVKYVAPEISGSGIPQVKAFLKGFPMRLDLRVAISKLIGGIVALGVGLPLGREGPTVQVGGATASVLARVGYQSPRHRRQLIAAGAGAGLAAAFNAPLAGVMFVVEELSKQVSSLAIGTAVLACFFAGVVSRYLGNHTLDISPSSIFPPADFFISSVPFCILLGIISGAVGSLFNEAIICSIKWHDKYLGDQFILRIGLAGLVCGIVIALLPTDFRDFNGVRQLIFENRTWRFAAVALLSNFVLTVWAYGSGAPGGLFAPSLNIGAAVGALIGVAAHWLGSTQPSVTLELAGMGAVFAAVARVPITATVVVFEMTADFNLLLPLMLSSITAFVVAERLSPGSLYDRLLEMQGYDLGEPSETDPLGALFVRDVMTKKVESVSVDMTLADVMEKFVSSKHKVFPVMEVGKLVGIIGQIDVISQRDLLQKGGTVREVMAPQVISTSPDEQLHEVLSLFDLHGLSRLPVLSAESELVGILTRSDIVAVLVRNGKRAGP